MRKPCFFIQDRIILHWTSLHKCILILVLASVEHMLWLLWKIYILKTPDLWQWVNLPILNTQLIINFSSLILLLGLIIPCYFLQGKKWAEISLPYLVVGLFTLTFFRDGYLIGLFSPAAFTGYICISAISLLLFQRKIVYPLLLLSIAAFLYVSWRTLNAELPYAPLFSPELIYQYPFNSPFWVSSMGFFIVPILIMSLLLSEVLLIQWRRRKSLIEKLSQIDPLTNLYNRRSFNEQLKRLHQAKKNYAVILLDLDYFKNINDQHGHRIGDEVLKQVAMVLKNNVRNFDIVARFGGEEFIILLEDLQLNQAIEIAERCRNAIRNIQLSINTNSSIQLTASFGLTNSDIACESEQIIHRADQALYHAKQQGRDQVQAYNQSLDIHSFL